ncbi:T9SS type A sorting domain-containing protein [bacterium]|nr:T9SS type A sorting domain-containing protein [bacterium]
MTSILIWVVMLAWAGTAHAVIHFVPDDFNNLQQALDESNSNDTIVCRAGTYRGPFFVWARNITIASEFILTHNPIDIANCIVRPSNGAPDNGCFVTQPADSTDTTLRMVGITLSLGRAITVGNNKGGGIYIRNRTADIKDCVFKSCLAGYGGAIYADSSVLTLKRCFMPGNDALYRGEVLYARHSTVHIMDSDIGPDGYFMPPSNTEAQIDLNSSSITISGTHIHGFGYGPEGSAIFLRAYDGSVGYMRLHGCVIGDNSLSFFLVGSGGLGPNELTIDSCLFTENSLPFGLWVPSFIERNGTTTITRCTFENSTVPPNTAGAPILNFSQTRATFECEQNHFHNNYGGTAACIGLGNQFNPSQGRVQRNYFSNNSSWGYPTWQSRTIGMGNVGEGVLEFNAFVGNIGYAVYTSDFFWPTSYALHNFWGDSTGPYEATRNPGGLGDTTNAATIYDEWLLSEDEIPDTTLYPPPNAADDRRWTVPSTWFISNVYPNPFNSEFRIELDGMTGADFEVRLFDLLGREVALLHSGRTLRGSLSFQAPSDLAAGVYFLHAKDHLYAETKKVLYLK